MTGGQPSFHITGIHSETGILYQSQTLPSSRINQYSPPNNVSIFVFANRFIWEVHGNGTAQAIANAAGGSAAYSFGSSYGLPSNPDSLWVANWDNVFYRLKAGPLIQAYWDRYSWGAAYDVTSHPTNESVAWVLGVSYWYLLKKTFDYGQTYVDVSGDMMTVGSSNPILYEDPDANCVVAMPSTNNTIILYVGGSFSDAQLSLMIE